jgi:hypothetical protein
MTATNRQAMVGRHGEWIDANYEPPLRFSRPRLARRSAWTIREGLA